MRRDSPIAYLLLYVALYGAFGVASPFWPKLFESKGLTLQQIGWILAATLIVRLVAGPLVGRLADAMASLRLVLAVSIAMAAAAAAAFLAINTFWFVLLIALVQAAALAPTTSIADALTVNTARPHLVGKPLEYGWIRGAASAAFLSGTLIVGQLITRTDLNSIIWMNVALLVVAVAATALLPRPMPEHEIRTSVLPVTGEARRLLKLPAFRTVIVVSALVYGSHALYDAFAVIRWSGAGLDASTISILWAEAVAAEVAVFFLIGPWLIDRIGTRGAGVVAALAGVVRWSGMSSTNSVLLLSLLQPLHGLTFALLHLACMRVLAIVVPVGAAATAQTLYAFGAGLVTAVLTSLSGTLYVHYGGVAFLSMATLCLIALTFAWYGLPNHADQRRMLVSP